MSLLYPRTIAIHRPGANSGVGAQPYGALQTATETTITTGLAARIQADRTGKKPTTGLPGDTAGESSWKIFFAAANGLTQARDIIIDDAGKRYQVIQVDWQPLVTCCTCQIMET